MATFNISRGMFLLLVFLWLIWPGSQQMMGRATENNDSHPRRTKAKGACGNIDIRNKVQNFVVLENCTVIEGQLQILLIDYANPKDYENLSFPDLVEITDYLLLYRVFGLKSLRNIFPNLAVIRGDKLFSNYALIAFEMPNLEELGLVKLNTITRGAVRLEKNPNLCYIETVDWSKIAKGIEASEHFFKNNKDIKECINTCPVNCPATSDGVRRCWTLEHCQTMLDCPNDCEYCNEGTCCNKNCIGGCTGPKDTDCTACRNVLDAVRPNCAERCSPGTYKFMNRRCLLDTECLNFTDYPLTFKLVNSTPSNNQQKECVLECPPKYIPDKNNISLCVPCVGKCPRVCNGKVIDSINSAQALEGCTIINGPLEINIMGGSSVGQELENNLAEIEVVTQYIRIYRSHALLSLHFFKNLREIQGKELWTDRYALTVFENSNLQELFTEEVTKNLKILNGSVWFHYNSKLCIKKIKLLLEPLNLLSNVSDMDVSPTTNGDQMPCEMQKLDLNVNPAMAQLAMLHWTPYHTADERQLISYTIYYKEAPERNVAIYQGRDACSSDLWRTIEEKPKPTDLSNNAVITSLLPNLKPWTQYVVYVQTLTISNAQEGGITPLVYFRTAPDIPTYPINLKVSSEMAGELRVTWDPPSSPNGNVTHYEVYWQKQDIDAAKYDVRDYCTNPLVDSNKGQKGREDKKDENKQNQTTSGCCECPKTKKELAIEEREREMEIKFQDYLQNEVYIKRLEWPASTIQPTKAQMTLKLFGASIGNTSSYRIQPTEVVNTSLTIDIPINRTSSSTPPPTTTEKRSSVSSHTESTPTPSNATTPQPKENPYYKAVVYKKREMHIGNLGHFEDYSIEVIACHERDQVNKHKLCSNRAIITGRTLPNETADSINMSTVNHTVSTNRTGEVMIQWSDPPHPNGLILTYEIEYSRANIKNIKPNIICIPHKMYQMHGGHTLDKLELGFNYTFRIRAMSLAGNGSWTEPMFFFLPPGEVAGSQVMIIAVVISVLLFVIVLIVVGVWCWFKRRFSKVPNTYISPNPDYFPNYDVYVADEWEVDRDKVRLIRELGQGSFGMVYEGIISYLNGQEVKIAIKTVNDSATDYERLMFLKEASIMKAFECHHVVRLIGVVSKTPPSLVLMELMSNDLKNFLRMHRPDEEDNEGRLPPTLKMILQMAGQIADGMAYLADKKYVHRDLAARNCMVAEDLTVKIGDFGMTRDIYETDYYRKGNRGLLPVRWMAPESLRDGVFTSMSDVWSFGVVLWEMATLAAQPYQGLSNEEVLRYVGNGKIMEKPEGCPEKLYDLMLKCWRFKPKQRPTFKEIIEILVPDLDPSFRDVSYFFNEGQLKSDEMKHIDLNDIDNEDYPHPMEGELDDSNLPFLSEVANNSQDQGVELDDLFHDTGYTWQPDHSNVGAEPCDCTLIQERDQASGGIPHHIISATRNSNSASSNSAIGAMDSGSSTEGSKDSSKSSSSSYALMNGLSVANGHLPIQVRTTPC